MRQYSRQPTQTARGKRRKQQEREAASAEATDRQTDATYTATSAHKPKQVEHRPQTASQTATQPVHRSERSKAWSLTVQPRRDVAVQVRVRAEIGQPEVR
jgi:hypothetical protein